MRSIERVGQRDSRVMLRITLGAMVTGCAGDAGRGGAIRTVIDTVGDTVIARTSVTLHGSAGLA